MALTFSSASKSNRLLQSLRYTMASQDNNEAFTNVLDLNAEEIYTQQQYIPSGSLPYSSSADHLSFVTATIDGVSTNIAQFYYEISMSRSENTFQDGTTKKLVWYAISGSGFTPNDTGINSTIIESNQLTNWISNKYASASLALGDAETPSPGNAYNVRVKVNGSFRNAGQYQFDYKTGVLQFKELSNAPLAADAVTLTGYRYIGQTLNEFISTGGGSGTPGGATTQVQFNDGGAFAGSEKFTFNKTTGLTQLSGSFWITGSVSNIFLIKSGSIDLLRMSSSGALVFGDLQHTPPPVAGGMFYSASAFYVGTE
jgi:hypothetical protein